MAIIIKAANVNFTFIYIRDTLTDILTVWRAIDSCPVGPIAA